MLDSDFPESSLKRLLGAIPAQNGLQVLRVSQDSELVDASAGLPLLLEVECHEL
jgi:hypothetical protein